MLSLLLAVPSCSCSFWHGIIPTSYFIFNDIYLIFYPGLALTVARGEMPYAYTYVVYITRATRTRMRIVRAINDKMASV